MGCGGSTIRALEEIGKDILFDDDVDNNDRNKPQPAPRQPTPPPRQPTPPPREPTPPPRQPTPPPREPTPPPREPTPPPREPTPPPREPTPPPREPTPPIRGVELGYGPSAIKGLAEFKKDFRVNPRNRPTATDPTKAGTLYTDKDFPLSVAIKEYKSDNIEWKRPSEFRDNPVLFSDGTTRFDIHQGSAGTCWFLTILSELADNPDFVKKVIPEDAWNPSTGVFKCNFYYFGQWETIYIDDFLPVVNGTDSWGANSAMDPNEMWVSLIEKGFAKLHGSYEATSGGLTGTSYYSLTGGVAEGIEFEDNPDPIKIFNRITNALKSGAMVACSVPEKNDDVKGLVGGHAYALNGTGVVKTKNGKEVRLVRVRNPWGHHEWTGPWSDGSKEWKTVVKKTVDNPNIDNGEFWMNLDDFMKYFYRTTVCNLSPDIDRDGSSDSLNFVACLYGDWVDDKAGGFEHRLENPRFKFSVPDEGANSEGKIPLVVQIIQGTKNRKTDRISIRCDLYKITGNGEGIAKKPTYVIEMLGKNTNVYVPEMESTYRHMIEPGEYIVIPSTINEGQEKQFLIRIFSTGPLSDIKEMSGDVILLSCKEEKYLEYNGTQYPLPYTESFFGEWISGLNAGGQISFQDTYHTNPQYSFSVPDTDHPVVFHVMQASDTKFAIGLRVFSLEVEPPAGEDYLYDHYDDCLKTTEDESGVLMYTNDLHVKYILPPGEYLALVFIDEPTQETSFSILVRSDTNLNFMEYNTGT